MKIGYGDHLRRSSQLIPRYLLYWSNKLISATQVKYDAMRHVGGSPQHRAAQPNNLVDQLDYFDERSRQSREREAHFHHFHM